MRPPVWRAPACAVLARGAVFLLLAAVGSVLSGSVVAHADSVHVVAKGKKRIRVVVRADRGERCLVVVRRGRRRTQKRLRMGRPKREIAVRLRGKGKIHVSVRCRRPPSKRSPRRQPQRVAFGPYDTVMAEVSDSHIRIYKGSGDRDLTLIYEASLDLPGWQATYLKPSGGYYEHQVDPFSADFSRVLFSGAPVGLNASHIGVLDLANGTAVDLTAPRQGNDFASPVLCEDNPGFQSQTSPVAGNGSDANVFLSRSGTLAYPGSYCFGDPAQSRVSDPAHATAIDFANDEQEPPSERVIGSGDGRYIFGTLRAPASGQGFLAADGTAQFPVDCGSSQTEFDGKPEAFLLGWIGPRTVVLALTFSGSLDQAHDWRTATLLDDGTVKCQGGVPPTDKRVTGVSLSFDNRAILFSVEEASGVIKYRQPIDGGPPVPASYPDLPECECSIYQVGPALSGK